MKKNLLLFAITVTLTLTACQNTPKKSWMAQALEVSSNQLKLAAGKMERTNVLFPGSLWYAYEMTGDEMLKAQAIRYTNLLNPVRNVKDTHDLECMICSYSNALRLVPNDTIEAALVEIADTLCTRLNSKNGRIRCGNMLKLLFSASKLTGNRKYYDTAVEYAQTTMKYHVRPDDGCHQDINNLSRAYEQAQDVYYYTTYYRETQDFTFLQKAMLTADTIMKQVKTADCIPSGDGNTPDGKESTRDVTAAGITASALLELSTLAPDGLKYFNYAETILKSLSQPDYLVSEEENRGYILKHSAASFLHSSESKKKMPPNEADYYYLEALKRYLDMLK